MDTFQSKANQIAEIIVEEEGSVEEITLPMIVRHISRIEHEIPDVIGNIKELIPRLSNVAPRIKPKLDHKIFQLHKCFVKSNRPLNPGLTVAKYESEPITCQTNYWPDAQHQSLSKVLVDEREVVDGIKAVITAYTLMIAKLEQNKTELEAYINGLESEIIDIQDKQLENRAIIDNIQLRERSVMLNRSSIRTNRSLIEKSLTEQTKLTEELNKAVQCHLHWSVIYRQLVETIDRMLVQHRDMIKVHLAFVTQNTSISNLIRHHNVAYRHFKVLRSSRTYQSS